MALKQCEQCSEMVDAAKAFCPACGFAFVEEKSREKVTDFEAMGQTVQLGQTMYNQMLTDMGLNIAKAPEPTEARVETIAPVEGAQTAQKTSAQVDRSKKGSSMLLIVTIAAAALILLAIVAAVVAAVFIFYFR